MDLKVTEQKKEMNLHLEMENKLNRMSMIKNVTYGMIYLKLNQ